MLIIRIIVGCGFHAAPLKTEQRRTDSRRGFLERIRGEASLNGLRSGMEARPYEINFVITVK